MTEILGIFADNNEGDFRHGVDVRDFFFDVLENIFVLSKQSQGKC